MKPKLIIITGTPGTGKTTLARLLAKKLNFYHLDLHAHYRKLATAYNYQKQCYDLNIKRVQKLVEQTLQEHPEGVVVDSHITHLLPPKLVDLCIVLTCSNLKVLYRRLKQRKYSEKKIQENMEAEIFQVCLDEAKERGHKVVVLDTSVLKKMNSLPPKLTKSL